MATSNKIRALNRLPFDFEDGLKVAGVDITTLNQASTPAGAGLIGFTPVGNLSAGNVQAALAELDSEKVGFARLDDTDGSSLVGYDGGTVQDVLDAVTGPSGAASIGYTPAGTGAVPTTVQAELRRASVTPERFGAIGDGNSHPLSTRFSTLVAAQAVYPHAAALTDEIDWCAWRAAVQYFYDKCLPQSTIYNQNFAHGKILATGQYMFNRTLTVDLLSLEIVGEFGQRTGETNLGGASTIRWNGSDGTIDAPNYIIDAYTRTELGATPAGRLPQARGVKLVVNNVGLYGKGSSMSGDPATCGFVSGIRLRQNAFCRIENCSFGLTLYDAIISTGPSLFCVIARNNFYGVYRDAISFPACLGDFSTTQWIRENEFGFVGRYSIFLDLAGSVEPKPIIENNSFEPVTVAGWYKNNPAYYVHGVTSIVFIRAGNATLENNRFEAITTYCDIHFLQSIQPILKGNLISNIVFSTFKASSTEFAALAAYKTANGFSDVTNLRNYYLGLSTDFNSNSQTLRLILCDSYAALVLIQVGGVGLGTSGITSISNTNFNLKSIPVVGDLANLAATQTTVTYHSSLVVENGAFNGVGYSYYDGNISSEASQITLFSEIPFRSGNVGDSANSYKSWYINRLAGNLENPSSYFLDNPFYHATPKTAGGAAIGAGYYEFGVVRKRKVRYEYSVAPTAGSWNVGDMVYNNAPSAGGVIGWVCVAAGTPGTWKSFGAISA